jgi:hypothetical protein
VVEQPEDDPRQHEHDGGTQRWLVVQDRMHALADRGRAVEELLGRCRRGLSACLGGHGNPFGCDVTDAVATEIECLPESAMAEYITDMHADGARFGTRRHALLVVVLAVRLAQLPQHAAAASLGDWMVMPG